MATSDIDSEQLISRFCGALLPRDRADFRRAAEAAIEQIPCAGEGVAYRTLRDVFRQYFHPPSDVQTGRPLGLGPFTGHLAIFADMRPRQRVEILLQLLGGEQRVTLATKDIEVVR